MTLYVPIIGDIVEEGVVVMRNVEGPRRPMTVAKLRELLASFPQDYEVYIEHPTDGGSLSEPDPGEALARPSKYGVGEWCSAFCLPGESYPDAKPVIIL